MADWGLKLQLSDLRSVVRPRPPRRRLGLIDRGLLGSFASADLRRAQSELAGIRGGKVFYDILKLGIPEIGPIFTEVGALWAYRRPDEPSVLQQYPALPDFVKPPLRVTNEALLGYAFDESTSPDLLSIIHLRAGRLAKSEGRPPADAVLADRVRDCR